MINHKYYIGQSTDIHRRWINHKSAYNNEDNNCYLYKAMRKYGFENFNFSVIEICSKELLNEREMYWINFYNSNDSNFGYNLTPGGDNNGIKTRKLNDNEVREIINLLPFKTQTEIGKLYNIDQSEVSRINYGKVYHFDDINYPICNNTFYINKRKPQDNYCIDCGKKICTKSIRCDKCNHKNIRECKLNGQPFPTREELKELIREKSFTYIGQKYNLTDNAIRKWCISMNLPYRKKEIKAYTIEEWETI